MPVLKSGAQRSEPICFDDLDLADAYIESVHLPRPNLLEVVISNAIHVRDPEATPTSLPLPKAYRARFQNTSNAAHIARQCEAIRKGEAPDLQTNHVKRSRTFHLEGIARLVGSWGPWISFEIAATHCDVECLIDEVDSKVPAEPS